MDAQFQSGLERLKALAAQRAKDAPEIAPEPTVIRKDLFNAPVPIPSRGPIEARPRLSRQSLEILSRLERGPASNTELVAIALKYTGRISEIRKAGYPVRVLSHDHATGRVIYTLGSEVP